MSTKMRAKFRISNIQKYEMCEILEFNAVGKSSGYDGTGDDEDNTYAKYTPSALTRMTINNPALLNKYKIGDVFYVDFTPV